MILCVARLILSCHVNLILSNPTYKTTSTITIQHNHRSSYRFEALEYAGILKEARSTKEGDEIIAKTRDYLLRTADGIRLDIRTHLNPKAIKETLDRNMKKDKPGTTGFGTGAFLGFVL